MYDIEEITGNMNDEGHPGRWFTVIRNMEVYRVQMDDGFEAYDKWLNVIVDHEEAYDIISAVQEYLQGEENEETN